MEIYSIGFTQKTAEQFFGILKRHGIKQLLDVRLKNVSQLSGFAKQADLEYFLREICGAQYIHAPILAPTNEMLAAYKKEKGSWEEYETQFLRLMAERKVESAIAPSLLSTPTVLLCSEPTAEYCHRRLVLEYLEAKWGDLKIQHL